MVNTRINGKYDLILPDHRAARPEWVTGWEVERIESMLRIIQKDNVVFDIGTEEGDISALLQKMTGCKMVLVEPNDRVWSCIKAIWEANELSDPLKFFPGFFSNESFQLPHMPLPGWEDLRNEKLISDHGFKQLYEQYPDVPQVKMDDWCMATGIYPDVITMDVEGSEFQVIKGAESVLRIVRPIVFMSVHPVFMKEHYNQEVGVMLKFMHDLNYRHEVIELDYHELHVVFYPNKF